MALNPNLQGAPDVTGDVLNSTGQGAAAGTAVMPGIGTAVGGIVGALGGIVAGIASGPERAKANAAAQAAYDQIQALGAPPDLAQQIILQQFKQVGLYSPQLEQQISQATSNVAGIQADQGTLAAQRNALQLMGQRGQTGMSAQDIAAYNQMKQAADIDAQGKSQQIMQNMQARGMGGSGSTFAQQLAAGQGGANMVANQGIQQAGQASQNALSALAQGGQMAGQLNNQLFGQAQTKANAQDLLNQFNTQNAINRQQRNIQSQNQAQQYNLGQQQNISNLNTQQANAEAYRQVAAQQQYWQDQLKLAQTKAGAGTTNANWNAGQAAATGQAGQNIASGLGKAAGSIYDNYNKAPGNPTNGNGAATKTDAYGNVTSGGQDTEKTAYGNGLVDPE